MNLQNESALHTVKIISVKNMKTPQNIGNGCLLYFRKLLFVLTVVHIKENSNDKLCLLLHNDPLKNNLPNWAPINPTYLKL